jgi:hypothetical protein
MGATARAQRGRWGALWITLTSRRDTMFGPLGASGCVREVHGEQRIVWRKCATTCENPQCSAGQSRWSDASVGRCLGLGLMYRHPCWPRNRHALDMIRWWGVERCVCVQSSLMVSGTLECGGGGPTWPMSADTLY